MANNAVGQERISKVVGYLLDTANFATSSPNLPQRIALLGEANHANQASVTENVAVTITSAQQAGQLFGFGSPIYNQARILFPVSGDGVGGIPVDVYPQLAASGATYRIQTLTVSGTATAGGTHYLKIAGRDNVDGVYYQINVASGDTATAVAAKINDAINAVLGSPVSSTLDSPPTACIISTKWKGLTAQDVTIEVDTNDVSLGLTYVVAQTTAGAGTPSISGALSAFGNTWYTDVSSCYGAVSAIMTSLETTNGKPDKTNPTGRYAGIIMKPFVAFIGSTSDDPSATTDARKTECTIAFCVAPASKGLPMEAAANYCVLHVRQAQDNPELDISGKYLPDMPVPSNGNIGTMATYTNRDAIVKKGCSTVMLNAGLYQIQDFVTTYHPDGEVPPQFRYVRSLTIDFNIRYGYFLKEQESVVDHVIANDNDAVSAMKVIKPKMWKQVLSAYFDDLVDRGLISDAAFSRAGMTVGLSTTNPDRLETSFPYKRSSYLRIAATTAVAGFNFGS
jgi:phage tail sheath gpL-like